MVAKISHGANIYGALAYNYEKVSNGTAIILSGNRMISDRLGIPSEDMRLSLLSFENYLLANRNTEKPVLHISLSPAPEDRLTDRQMESMAAMYMEKMGYGNQPYIVYKHNDTHNPHIHIVSVCVDEYGKKINDSYEHRRSMKTCRELETEYGLKNGADTEIKKTRTELKKVDISKGDIKHQIGNILKGVMESYRFQSLGEYTAILSTFNVQVKSVNGEYNGKPYNGIIYFATDKNGKISGPPFKSSKFGKRFGNEGIKKKAIQHTESYRKGNWFPSIRSIVAEAIRNARSKDELTDILKRNNIDIVFRKNENGRIYGITFIDHENREAFNGSRLGREFSANIFNELFAWWNGIPENDRYSLGGGELWKHYSFQIRQGSILEQAAGILSAEENPATDYEEEAFRRRMKRKQKQIRRKSRGI